MSRPHSIPTPPAPLPLAFAHHHRYHSPTPSRHSPLDGLLNSLTLPMTPTAPLHSRSLIRSCTLTVSLPQLIPTLLSPQAPTCEYTRSYLPTLPPNPSPLPSPSTHLTSSPHYIAHRRPCFPTRSYTLQSFHHGSPLISTIHSLP